MRNIGSAVYTLCVLAAVSVLAFAIGLVVGAINTYIMTIVE